MFKVFKYIPIYKIVLIFLCILFMFYLFMFTFQNIIVSMILIIIFSLFILGLINFLFYIRKEKIKKNIDFYKDLIDEYNNDIDK